MELHGGQAMLNCAESRVLKITVNTRSFLISGTRVSNASEQTIFHSFQIEIIIKRKKLLINQPINRSMLPHCTI